jgi:hypothetical protein
MESRFGTTTCSHCGREFERVRSWQHLCSRVCHDLYFMEERRQALAAWRKQQQPTTLRREDAA